MKKSQLVQAIKEEMKGYSKYAQGGETKGGTTDDFRNILTAIAKQGQTEDEPQPEIEEDADKTRAGHLGHLRGTLMSIITFIKAERPYEEILALAEKALNQTSSSDPLSEGEGEQTYLVYYRVGEDDDDDVEVKASSPEEAIEKAKAGKTAGGQNMPRLARSFSAKLINK